MAYFFCVAKMNIEAMIERDSAFNRDSELLLKEDLTFNLTCGVTFLKFSSIDERLALQL